MSVCRQQVVEHRNLTEWYPKYFIVGYVWPIMYIRKKSPSNCTVCC